MMTGHYHSSFHGRCYFSQIGSSGSNSRVIIVVITVVLVQVSLPPVTALGFARCRSQSRTRTSEKELMMDGWMDVQGVAQAPGVGLLRNYGASIQIVIQPKAPSW